MSNKIGSMATVALEITKMVLVIAANTTCKLISVGKSEVAKQYTMYQQKATPQQLEALRMFKEMASKGTSMAKSELKGKLAGKSTPVKKIDPPKDKPKK